MPKRARCVFRGNFFRIYQWRQRLFDGTTKTFELAVRPDSTLVIPVRTDGKIIFQRQKQPNTGWFISLPGGVRDAGETPRTSAVRELIEETGFRPKRMAHWMTLPPQFRVHSKLYVYVAHGCVRVKNPDPGSGEKIQLHFASFKEFLNIARRKDFRHRNITLEVLDALTSPKKMSALRRRILGN